MKKMIPGAILMICGFMGVVVLMVLSVEHPWVYNKISGFFGFLLGSGTIWFFILFSFMALFGISIIFYEAYRKSE